jgi:hypothetical protein
MSQEVVPIREKEKSDLRVKSKTMSGNLVNFISGIPILLKNLIL